MANDIQLNVTGDTQGLIDAVAKGAVSVEKLEDVLDDAAKTGADAGEKLEKSLDGAEDAAEKLGKAGKRSGDDIEKGMRDAQRDTKDLEAEIKDARDAFEKAGRAGRDLGDNVYKGAKKGEGAIDEMGDEALQEAKEMGASFGSVEDALDSVQSVISNMFVGFGPAGIVAGVAVAAGIGLAMTAGQDAAEAINQAKERVSELTLELYEAGGDIDQLDIGGKMREWGVEIADTKEFWEIWQEGAVTNIGKAAKAAKLAQTDFETMFRGMSGYDAEAAERALEAVTERIDEMEDTLSETEGFGRLGAAIGALGERTELTNLQKQLQNTVDVMGETTEEYNLLEEAELRQAEAAQEAADIRNDAASSLQAPLDEAVSGFENFKDAETEALDPAAYIASINERIEATGNFNANVATISETFGLSAAESQAILDQGISFAPMLQAIIDSGLAPEFVTQIQNAVGGGQDILDGSDLNATVDVDADVSPSEKAIRVIEQAKRSTKDIEVDADTSDAKRKIAAVEDGNYSTTVKVHADLSSAQRAITGFMNQPRSIRINATIVDPHTGRRVD
ncbi:hypothetical protein [Marisediminicola sp. LYQ85]|uniref:hypothetical protein n=1 Tax=Marisediminicola sp. LYQ85 TaxID=3391062 RepID=UPI0039839F7D